jgi:hypothetical protein
MRRKEENMSEICGFYGGADTGSTFVGYSRFGEVEDADVPMFMVYVVPRP